jgi:hypothetical protein
VIDTQRSEGNEVNVPEVKPKKKSRRERKDRKKRKDKEHPEELVAPKSPTTPTTEPIKNETIAPQVRGLTFWNKIPRNFTIDKSPTKSHARKSIKVGAPKTALQLDDAPAGTDFSSDDSI